MRAFEIRRGAQRWQARCDECGEVTDAASLAPLGSWFYKHTCPQQNRCAAMESGTLGVSATPQGGNPGASLPQLDPRANEGN